MACTLGRVGRPVIFDFRDDFDPIKSGWTDFGITTIGGSPDDPTRYLTEVGGELTLNGVTGAGYKLRDVPNVREIRVGHHVSTGTANSASALGIVSSHIPVDNPLGLVGVAFNSVHISVAATGRNASYFDGAFTPAVDTDTFTLSSGNDYETRLVFDPDTGLVHIYDPDGGNEVLPAGSEGLWGDTIFVECLNANLAHRLASIDYVVVIGEVLVELQSPKTIRRDGNNLKLAGSFAVTDTEGRILAAQLTGLGPHNADEPLVLFTYDADQPGGDLDGIYAVVQTTVDYDKLAAGLFSWSAELVAVPDYQAPRVEATVQSALRVNDHSIAEDDVIPWHAPGTTDGVFSYDGLSNDDAGSTNGVYGSVAIKREEAAPIDTTASWSLILGDEYDASARFGTSYDDGVTWHPAIGRQIHNEPVLWRASNGLIRIEGNPDGEAVIDLTRTGAAGDGVPGMARSFRLCATGFTDIIDPARSVACLLNRPEAVKIRVRYFTAVTAAHFWLDILLRRGALYAECILHASSVKELGVQREVAEAATALTGGIRATADDGGYYVLATPRTFTDDLTQGGIRLSSTATRFPFAIGIADSLSASNLDGAQGLIYGYMATTSEHQQLVPS